MIDNSRDSLYEIVRVSDGQLVAYRTTESAAVVCAEDFAQGFGREYLVVMNGHILHERG